MPLPGHPFIAPMLATAADHLPPDDSAWAYEFKWDGVRALVFVDGGGVCVQGRRQVDVTDRYPELAGIAEGLGGRSAILDGEVVAVDDRGRPSFQLLQQRMHVASAADARRRMNQVPVAWLGFDVLALDGNPTLDLPYSERRALLDGLELAGPRWQVPPSHVGDGPSVLEASRAAGLEGVVAKRLDSRYEPGRRSRCWLKLKNHRRQEFVVGGWTAGEGSRSDRFGSLMVGVYEGDDLVYAGNVGTGFTEKTLDELSTALAPLRRTGSPFVNTPRLPGRMVFVEPVLVAEVEYSDWTNDGRLRHPSFKGLRPDKDPREVVREEPA
ncbi:MAG TPA: non-homologous end-joining DNA ligase [Acidimicrobiales bacterium]|nr:non-homologous end-joining DNA ligase [Acidimicrobiales bacterium]